MSDEKPAMDAEIVRDLDFFMEYESVAEFENIEMLKALEATDQKVKVIEDDGKSRNKDQNKDRKNDRKEVGHE